ncbi:hypothetical protein KP79_PYT09725 [Mizuhopecten yessoensis]|uniref:Transmembrane protein n=1 Tax=Mizuhopecten yessoensis TaxID=6573 RepID=A0A210PHE6_MIZYE|nr:hypothetical protein KP79_PYT09725 [Mizuhopecten yessoensis]
MSELGPSEEYPDPLPANGGGIKSAAFIGDSGIMKTAKESALIMNISILTIIVFYVSVHLHSTELSNDMEDPQPTSVPFITPDSTGHVAAPQQEHDLVQIDVQGTSLELLSAAAEIKRLQQQVHQSKALSNMKLHWEILSAALGLQATSFAIHLLIYLTSIWLMCCSGEDADDVGCCLCCAGCSIMMYPAAGLFSIIGCGVMSTIDVPEFSYGYSFGLCLASGVYVMLQAILVCYCLCKASDDDDDFSASRQTPTTVATTGASGQLNLAYNHQEQHVAVVVTEREEQAMSNGVMILRKLRIMQIVRLGR